MHDARSRHFLLSPALPSTSRPHRGTRSLDTATAVGLHDCHSHSRSRTSTSFDALSACVLPALPAHCTRPHPRLFELRLLLSCLSSSLPPRSPASSLIPYASPRRSRIGFRIRISFVHLLKDTVGHQASHLVLRLQPPAYFCFSIASSGIRSLPSFSPSAPSSLYAHVRASDSLPQPALRCRIQAAEEDQGCCCRCRRRCRGFGLRRRWLRDEVRQGHQACTQAKGEGEEAQGNQRWAAVQGGGHSGQEENGGAT